MKLVLFGIFLQRSATLERVRLAKSPRKIASSFTPEGALRKLKFACET